MAISPQLRQFKSSGVYRLEFDKSQTSNINISTLRLLVGHSKKGPFNSPTLIENAEDFKNVYGDIDKSLEKKGMFFHRSCLAALSRGPILALSLKNFTANDKANLIKPSTAANYSKPENLTSGILIADTAYTAFHNIDKFMTPSDESLLLISGATANNNIIALTNLKTAPITVVIRTAENIDGFEITADEWYGTGNVPAYLHDKDYLSDFLIDVFVFKGKFDHVALQNDSTYGNYFDANGLIKAKLDAFSNLRTVTTLAKYTGSLLPGFKDMEGRGLYIESMINAEARRTGLFCAVDEDKVLHESVKYLDFIGHTLQPTGQDWNTSVLSYPPKRRLKDVVGDIVENSQAITGNQFVIKYLKTDAIDYPSTFFQKGDYLHALEANRFAKVLQVQHDNAASGNRTYTIKTDCPIDPAIYDQDESTTKTAAVAAVKILTFTGPLVSSNTIVPTVNTVAGSTITFGTSNDATLAAIATEIATNTDVATASVNLIKTLTFDNPLVTGDSVIVTVNSVALTLDTFATTNDALLTAIATKIALNTGVTSAVVTSIGSTAEDDRVIVITGANGGALAVSAAVTSTGAGDAAATLSDVVTDDRAIVITAQTAGTDIDVSVVVADGGSQATAALTTATANVVASDSASNLLQYLVPFEREATAYVPFYIDAATITTTSVSDCVSQLSATSLSTALKDKDLIDFRYIVDTFGSIDSVNGLITKSEITSLAKDRQNASAIMNAPTVADFKSTTGNQPQFVDAFGKFKTSYIKDGGRADLNPTELYTLPSVALGANYAFYYAPGLLVKDSGKNIIVPPAAYVSNNFIDKYTAALPWSIVAGPRRGVVGGSGVVGAEYTFDKADRDILEPFGINPIVFQRGVGLTILGNKTAQQSIKSALSSAHVREVLIYIQDGINDILKDYVFEFNTVQARLEIKTLVDSFLESVKQDQGVYDFKNIMDSTNNDSEVIDNNMGIIDTYVEPVKGLEIVVHRTTVLNTGEIAAGSFL